MWGPKSFKDMMEFIWYYKWEMLKALLPVGIPIFLLGLLMGWILWA